MCNHHNILKDECGATCADCNMYFAQSLCSEFKTCYNGPVIEAKPSVYRSLEKFGICDQNVLQLAQEIFDRSSKNKIVKGSNKLAILCASVYYAYFYLENPKNFGDILALFNITHKTGIKGLKICQIAIQEQPLKVFPNKSQISSFSETHKEKLEELLKKYSIPLAYYNDIEKIIAICHQKKNKLLNDKINNLWISGIFYWLLQINPAIDPEEFVSISSDNITLHQLKTDMTYIKKIIM